MLPPAAGENAPELSTKLASQSPVFQLLKNEILGSRKSAEASFKKISDGPEPGVLTIMPDRRQSVSAHAGERLPALASRVTVLSLF
jgi:hypothetical protein